MKNLIEKLDEALKLLSPIAVSHDAVDFMALAKQNIRVVKAELEKMKQESNEKESEAYV